MYSRRLPKRIRTPSDETFVSDEQQNQQGEKKIETYFRLPESTHRVLRLEGENKYLLFVNFTGIEVAEYVAKLYLEDPASNQLCLHEIIPSESNQKIYFDVDISLAEHPSYTWQDMVQIYTELIWKLFKNPEFLVFSSSDATKISLHFVVFNLYAKNNLELKEFMSFVKNRYDPPGMDLLYKKNQGFRMPLCHKVDSARYKLPMMDDNTQPITMNMALKAILVGMITYFPVTARYFKAHIAVQSEFQRALDAIPPPSAKKNLLHANLDPDKMLKYISDWEGSKEPCYVVDGHKLVRTAESYCPICQRVHSSENKHVVVTNKGIYVGCFRNTGKKVFIPFTSPPTKPDTPALKPVITSNDVSWMELPKPNVESPEPIDFDFY